MNRIVYIAAAAALCVAQSAAASPDRMRADALAGVGLDGIRQQGHGGGKGNGGAAHAQGGGQGGGSARSQGGGNSGGGSHSAARPQQGGGRSDHASQGGGSSGSARGRSSGSSRDDRGSSASGSNRARGSSDDSRGNSARRSSDDSRGNGARRSSDDSRGNSSRGSDDRARGNSSGNNGSNGNGAASGNSAGNHGSGSAAHSSRGGRGRLGDADLSRHLASLPANVRAYARSRRASERMAAGALARSIARGGDVNRFDVRSQNGGVRILNRRGDLLVDLDENRARTLGGWQMRRLGDRQPRANAPAFCRSGEGHPVWGREWCLDKGFGLGSRSGTLWSRGTIDDVTWRRQTDDRMDRGGLIGVLGDIVLGRLALQAVTLGYDQPLAGYWVAQPEGPRLLRVRSGEYEVAEFVDTNRDDRVDVLYVSQPVYVVQARL
jgi:hypothetical protein